MNFAVLQQKAGRVLIDNASTIFTGLGVVGVAATAVFTAKATLKAASVLEGYDLVEPTTVEKIKKVWPYFIPPVLVGGATITSIVMANRVNARRIAVLTAAYGLSESRFKEYREKVQDKLTTPKAQSIDDAIAQDHVNANPPPGNLVVIEGEVLCLDKLTGRYFHSTVERIRQAERAVNDELQMVQYASLSEFYDHVGLAKTQFTDQVGWNTLGADGPLKVELSTAMTPDGRPCVSIDFNYIPRPDAHKLY